MPDKFVIAAANDLFIIPQGFFNSVYLLADEKHTYGELTHHGFFPRKASVKTASAEWEIMPEGFWGTKTLIRKADGSSVAEVSKHFFKSGYDLQLTDGKVFKFDRPSFWSSLYVWTDVENKMLVLFKLKPFSKKRYQILYDKNSNDANLTLLLAFLGLYFLLAQQTKKSAAQ